MDGQVAVGTSVIGVLVRDDPDRMIGTLQGTDRVEWKPDDDADAEPNVTVDAGGEDLELIWTDAHGGTRYTYLERDGRGQWLDAHAQFHAGRT